MNSIEVTFPAISHKAQKIMRSKTPEFASDKYIRAVMLLRVIVDDGKLPSDWGHFWKYILEPCADSMCHISSAFANINISTYTPLLTHVNASLSIALVIWKCRS